MEAGIGSSGAAECFHCGQPLAGAHGLTVMVDGAARDMCCAGCRAVAQAIVDGGLERYYRHRQSMPASAAQTVPVELQAFAIYDDPAVQSGFVRSIADAPPAINAKSSGQPGDREAALLIEGITCAACVWLVERTLQKLPGVSGIEINYSTRRARIRWDAGRIELSAILRSVASVGYRASPFDAARVDTLHRKERSRALSGLAIAGLGMMQVMMYAVPVWLADGDLTADAEQLMRWAGLVLTLPVLLYSAAPILGGAWRDLRARALGMDVPVAIGILAAFAASAFATVSGAGAVYFDSVTMFVFLLLAARFLESQVRARAARATDELARLIPATAERLLQWPRMEPSETVPVAALRAGDTVLVRPGERIPGDGHLIEGEGEIDEALLTGESRPVVRGAGAALTAGAINLVSPLVMRIAQVGERTVLAGIVRLLDRAAAEKPPLAAMADRVAGSFVLGLLIVAAGVAAWWAMHDPARALWVTVAVLVITCPCALSLATPAALAAAASTLTRQGLLPTRGHAIETLARATHFVFDKTGTLTSGRLHVTGFDIEPGIDASPAARRRLLDAVVALERRSEHPLGRALCQFAERDVPLAADDATVRVEGLRHVPGGGVEASVDGRRYRLGTPAFAAALAQRPRAGADAGGDDARFTEAMQRAETCVVLADATGVLARFSLADQLRPGARELVDGLIAAGGQVLLLSGDREPTVEAFGRLAGFGGGRDTVRGGMTPQSKLDFVRRLQAGGAVVAMFGDGVNDAPVLAQAQVSIAPATGTLVAQSAADMIWIASGDAADMRSLLDAVRMARVALSVIRQNLAWAVAYNLVAVPLAVAGLVTPWVAALGMSASSLLVVGNSMRLLRPRQPAGASPLEASSPVTASAV